MPFSKEDSTLYLFCLRSICRICTWMNSVIYIFFKQRNSTNYSSCKNWLNSAWHDMQRSWRDKGRVWKSERFCGKLNRDKCSQNREKKRGVCQKLWSHFWVMQKEEKQDETAVETVSALLLSGQRPVTSFSIINGQMAKWVKIEFIDGVFRRMATLMTWDSCFNKKRWNYVI